MNWMEKHNDVHFRFQIPSRRNSNRPTTIASIIIPHIAYRIPALPNNPNVHIQTQLNQNQSKSFPTPELRLPIPLLNVSIRVDPMSCRMRIDSNSIPCSAQVVFHPQILSYFPTMAVDIDRVAFPLRVVTSMWL